MSLRYVETLLYPDYQSSLSNSKFSPVFVDHEEHELLKEKKNLEKQLELAKLDEARKSRKEQLRKEIAELRKQLTELG